MKGNSNASAQSSAARRSETEATSGRISEEEDESEHEKDAS